jgi:hypothetical protein
MRVFICSPFAGDTVRNILRAQGYCRKAVAEGHVPYAPHLYFPQFLDDKTPQERERGMKLGLSWLSYCDEMWVFGELSPGMQTEIAYAAEHQIPIRYFPAEQEDHFDD